MQIYYEGEQASLFDPACFAGRTSPVRSAREPPKGRTSGSSSRRSSELKYVVFQSLDLTPGVGNLLGESYWERISPWRGGASMLNTGVSPREEKGSSLSQILQDDPPDKYSLTTTACLGILRRSSERGKELPGKLKRALEIQAGLVLPDGQPTALEAYHINQRDEGIDLHGIAGALMATKTGAPTQAQRSGLCGERNHSGMSELSRLCGSEGYGACGDAQMQTFVTQPEVGAIGDAGGMQPIAFAANQRDEVRDLHDVAAALQASPGMKQQTLVTAAFSAGAGATAGSIGYSEQVAPTIKGSAGGNSMPSVLCLNDQGGSVMDCSEDMAGTLRAQTKGHEPLVFENHGIDARYTGPHAVSPTMSARYGTGGNNTPLVAQELSFCITGNAVGREPQNGGNGLGVNENLVFTLTATDRHCVYSRQRVDVFKADDVTSTESARQSKDATDLVIDRDSAGKLIRRLTPLECERLQGFPDGWTDIPGTTDSARYKALGNSVAIPCVDYVLQGMAMVLNTMYT